MDELNALIRQAKCYDEKAFSKIYKRFYQQVYRYIYYRTNDRNVAEDLTAETFLKVLENIKTYRKDARSFLSWVIKIAYRLVVDHYRAANKSKRFSSEQLESRIDLKTSFQLVEEDVVNRLDGEVVWQAVRKLTDEQQQVIYLKFGLGLSNREVAEILGKREGAIKSLQIRALESLKRIFNQIETKDIKIPEQLISHKLKLEVED
jgi:RNA polymerase sigma-70 factor (ECF subfamily)